ETFEEIGRRWMPWAANGCTIRVGELILIVDSDTLYRRIASGKGCDRGLPTIIISRLHEEREAPWRYQPLRRGTPSMARACMCMLHRLLLFHRKPAGEDDQTLHTVYESSVHTDPTVQDYKTVAPAGHVV
ncbi:hypothetical protein JB92DRAFT_3041309, partial [Gautieria morchelliformis]